MEFRDGFWKDSIVGLSFSINIELTVLSSETAFDYTQLVLNFKVEETA